MDLIKRVLGFHKTPPVLVAACAYELECISSNIVPSKGRRVLGFKVDFICSCLNVFVK